MASPSENILKLASEGEQAGLTFEQMIEILSSGVTIAELLRIIQWKLSGAKVPPGAARWIM